MMRNKMNDDILYSWLTYLDQSGIKHSPVEAWLDQEMMADVEYAVDASKFVRMTGFEYQVKELRGQHFRDVVDAFLEIGAWPLMLKYKE